MKPLTFDEFPAASYAAWRAGAEAALKGASFDKKLRTPTREGIVLEPIYHRADLASLSGTRTVPGQPPYIRGTRTNNRWQVAEDVSAAKPADAGKNLQAAIAGGAETIFLEVTAPAAPSMSAHDLEEILRGFDPAAHPLHLRTGADGLPGLTLLISALKSDRETIRNLQGSLGQDPIGKWAAKGSIPTDATGALDRLAATTRWLLTSAPGFGSISVDAACYHNAGATSVQEIAFAVATGLEYLRQLESRGLPVQDAAQRICFDFATGPDFFMALAKFRAARQIWSQIVSRCGGDDSSQAMTIHACTSLWNRSALDSHVNLLRCTTEACAAALSGCDSLRVAPFDEVLGTADAFTRRIARNTQLILRDECDFGQVVDPAGGSYYVENLTAKLAGQAWALFQEIERDGGMIGALRNGAPQRVIAGAAACRQDEIAHRRSSLVGVNQYADPSAELATSAVPQPQHLATEKPNAELATLLKKSGAASKEQWIATATSAADLGASLAQISSALEAGAEAFVSIESLPLRRVAAPFEQLRLAVQAAGRPRVFLAGMGPLRQHKARADFSAGFFAVGGFAVVEGRGFSTAGEAAAAAIEDGAPVVVLCSTDETWPELVPPLAAALKAMDNPPVFVLAGWPADLAPAFTAAGVDHFIHLRSNCLETLQIIASQTGARP